MHKHLIDLSILFLILIIFTISLQGWGRLLSGYVLNKKAEISVSLQLWMGIFVAVIYAELVQLVFPLNLKFTWPFFIGGMLLSIRNLMESCNLKKYNINRNDLFIYLMGFFIISIWFSKAMFPPGHYDFYLYYLPTVNWLGDFSISFGLANLHSRLGFNQSLFSIAALLDLKPYFGHGLIAVNLLLSILTFVTIYGLCKALGERGKILFFVFILVFVEWIYHPVSPSPDFTIGMIQSVIFLILVSLFTCNQDPGSNQNLLLISILILLSVFCLTIKLSSGVFVLTSLLISSKKIIYVAKNNTSVFLKILLICCVLACIHSVRGYVLSGYPLYPISIAGMPNADWSLPIGVGEQEVRWIYSWARAPGKDPEVVLANWNWISGWVSAFPVSGRVLFGLAGLFMILDFAIVISNKAKVNSLNSSALVYIPLLISVMFWFLSAPDIRFLGAIPELLLVLSLWRVLFSIQSTQFWNKKNVSIRKIIFYFSLSLVILFFINIRTFTDYIFRFLVDFFYSNLNSKEIGWKIEGIHWRLVSLGLIVLFYLVISTNFKKLIKDPFISFATVGVLSLAVMSQVSLLMGFFMAEQQGWRSSSKREYRQYKTESGISINIPVSGDQCGEIPFPCMPYENLKIHEIENKFFDYSHGFKNLGVK